MRASRLLVFLVVVFVFSAFSTSPLDAQGVNVAVGGTATQSSQLGGFSAGLAIDGNLGNFTHTNSGQDLATTPTHSWRLDLGSEFEIDLVVLHNRSSCCGSRLRDVIVRILDASDTEVFATSSLDDCLAAGEGNCVGLLNADNVDGTCPLGPASITVDLGDLVGAAVTGQFVEVHRIPDLDDSGCTGNNDEATVLSLGEVEVFSDIPCPAPDDGDTHCLGITEITGPADGGPGDYAISATAMDDSGDDIIYTFTAESTEGAMRSAGPQSEPIGSLDLAPGTWTVRVTVDDSELCDDVAADAVCEQEVIVGTGPNVALGKPTSQSSQLGGFAPDLAVDGNAGNFTHTSSAQDLTVDPVHWWQVELGEVFDIGSVIARNRTSCCGSRLRDITIVILSGGEEVFRSPLLNAENVQGSPPFVAIDTNFYTGGTIAGDTVRIERTPDPDLSGTGGTGNNDEAAVLSLGEVEVNTVPAGCPVDGDSHCTLLTVEGPADDAPGTYALQAEGVDDSGEGPLYTFSASLAGDDSSLMVIGPQASPSASFLIVDQGIWTFGLFVDDDLVCHDVANDASCSEMRDISVPCPVDGDTHAQELLIEPVAPVATRPDGAGLHRVTVTALDDSGDTILYSLTADNGEGTLVERGPQEDPTFDNVPLSTAGEWEITARVDDTPFCDDEALDSTISEVVTLIQYNVALGKVASQSSQLNQFEAGIGVNGNTGDFTHTLAAADLPGPAWWEVDLGEMRAIEEIVIHNRSSCCGSRLRDVDVTILDAFGNVVFDILGLQTVEEIAGTVLGPGENESLLNAENILGEGTNGPPTLTARFVDDDARKGIDESVAVFTGGPVVGQFVRVWRFPDEDLSGTGGVGNDDEATVLSIGEVEVFRSLVEPQPAPQFRRGDVDQNGELEVTDPINGLTFQFLGTYDPPCMDALDYDDNGKIEVTDAINNLSHQFLGEAAPPAPGKDICGPDTTPDDRNLDGTPGEPGDDLGCETEPENC